MSDEPLERRPEILGRLRDRLPAAEPEEPGPPASPGGLLGRLHGGPASPPPSDTGSHGLGTRLGRLLRRQREAVDLVLAMTAGPRLLQQGNFARIVSNGGHDRCRPATLFLSDPARPSFLLLPLPRADLLDRTLPGLRLPPLLVVAPDLDRRYELAEVHGLHWCPSRTEALPDRRVPLLLAETFPLYEHALDHGRGLIERIRSVLRARDVFADCLGTALADVLVGHGASVWRIDYWYQHVEAEPTPHGTFQPDEIECPWSGDPATITRHLGRSLEIGAVQVPASGYYGRQPAGEGK